MKHLGKRIGVVLTVAAALFCCMLTAFAEGEQPRIVLKESGVQNQYILRLDQFSSKFESVQFQIVIDGQVEKPEEVWTDDSADHFQLINAEQSEGKTVLTVYIDQLRPIANSGSRELATLTFSQAIPASGFSPGSEMIALDEHQEKTVFSNPKLIVSAIQTGGGNTGSGGGSSTSGGSWLEGENDSDDSPSYTSTSTRTSLSWEDVSGRLTQSGGQKTLTIRVREGEVISRDIFLQAAKEKALLKLNYGDFIWIFDTSKGVSIPANRLFFDFSIETIRYKNLSAAVENTDLVQFEISYSGALPCNATLSYLAGESAAEKTLHLSYYNEKEATLEFRESAKASADGMITFSLTHASKYVISTKNMWETTQKDELTHLAASGTVGGAGAAAGTGTQVVSGGNQTAANVTVLPEDQVEEREHIVNDGQDTGGGEEQSAAGEESGETITAPETVEAAVSQPEKSDNGNRFNSILVLCLIVAAAALVAIGFKLYAGRRR